MGSNKLSIATFGLALLCAPPSWAGSAGGVIGGPSVPVPATRYGFCFASDSRDVYYSKVFTYTTGPKTGPNVFGLAFWNYLRPTYPGSSWTDPVCRVDDAKAEVERLKKTAAQRIPGDKIVETNWRP